MFHRRGSERIRPSLKLRRGSQTSTSAIMDPLITFENCEFNTATTAHLSTMTKGFASPSPPSVCATLNPLCCGQRFFPYWDREGTWSFRVNICQRNCHHGSSVFINTEWMAGQKKFFKINVALNALLSNKAMLLPLI